MYPIDIVRIEREARQLRAKELQRINGLIAARLGLYGQLLAATALSALAALGESLRPLFSWNPKSGHSA